MASDLFSELSGEPDEFSGALGDQHGAGAGLQRLEHVRNITRVGDVVARALAGVLVGGILAWRKVPFVVVVIAAAAVLRLLGVP